MDKLKIDTQGLRDIASALTLIGHEFQDANENSDTLADAVGEHELASRVKDFAHNWDVRRKDFVDKISTLQKSVAEGAAELEKVDKQLADGLTDKK